MNIRTYSLMAQQNPYFVPAIILIMCCIFIAGCSTPTSSVTQTTPLSATPRITIPQTIKTVEKTLVPTTGPTPLPEKSVTAKTWQKGDDIIIEYLGGPGHEYVDDITWEVFPGTPLYQTIEGMGTFPMKSQKGYDLAPHNHFIATVEGLGTSERDHVVIVARYNISPFFETILDTYV